MKDRITRETIGVAVLVLLAIVCAALVVAVVTKTRDDAAQAAREAAAYTPPTLGSASSVPSASPRSSASPRASASASASSGSASAAATTVSEGSSGPVVALIADQTASGAAAGVDRDERWTALIADELGVRVRGSVVADSGYVTEGSDGRTLADAVPDVPRAATAVVLLGGGADASAGVSALALAQQASQILSQTAQRAPDAQLVVVGPLYRPQGVSSAAIGRVRDGLRSAAALAGAQFVDPVSAGWLDGVRDVSDLTAAEQSTIAARMQETLSPVLAAAG